jgi:hypothetical protein
MIRLNNSPDESAAIIDNRAGVPSTKTVLGARRPHVYSGLRHFGHLSQSILHGFMSRQFRLPPELGRSRPPDRILHGRPVARWSSRPSHIPSSGRAIAECLHCLEHGQSRERLNSENRSPPTVTRSLQQRPVTRARLLPDPDQVFSPRKIPRTIYHTTAFGNSAARGSTKSRTAWAKLVGQIA